MQKTPQAGLIYVIFPVREVRPLRICSELGCERKHYGLGLRDKHYYRMKRDR